MAFLFLSFFVCVFVEPLGSRKAAENERLDSTSLKHKELPSTNRCCKHWHCVYDVVYSSITKWHCNLYKFIKTQEYCNVLHVLNVNLLQLHLRAELNRHRFNLSTHSLVHRDVSHVFWSDLFFLCGFTSCCVFRALNVCLNNLERFTYC